MWRWRRAFQNGFAARMDWCVKPLDQANHPPVAELVGSRHIAAAPRTTVHLSAEKSSDPDGDELVFRWWHYKEAGTYGGRVKVQGADRAKAAVEVPADAQRGQTIHLICEVTDNGSPPLTRYGRVILTTLAV